MVTVAEQVSGNITTVEALQIYRDFLDSIRDPEASPEFLMAIAEEYHRDQQVAGILVSHPNVSEETMRLVIEKNTLYMYLTATAGVNVYALEYAYTYDVSICTEKLITSPVHLRLARNPDTPGWILEEMWFRFSRWSELEDQLAKHRNLTVKVAAEIYKSSNFYNSESARCKLQDFYADYPDEWFEEMYPSIM